MQSSYDSSYEYIVLSTEIICSNLDLFINNIVQFTINSFFFMDRKQCDTLKMCRIVFKF